MLVKHSHLPADIDKGKAGKLKHQTSTVLVVAGTRPCPEEPAGNSTLLGGQSVTRRCLVGKEVEITCNVLATLVIL